MKKKTNTFTLHWISEVAGSKKIYIVILLIVQMVLGISSIFYALILRNMIDAAVAGYHRAFYLTMAAFTGLVIIQISLRALNRYFEECARATMENIFKKRLFAFLLTEDYEQMTAIHSGEWMNRMTSDTVVVADGLAQIVPGVVGMLTKMIGALIMILVLEPRFAYILIPGGVLLTILTYGFRKKLKKLHKKIQEVDGQLRVFLQESLSSMLVVRAFVKENQVINDASDKMKQHKKTRMKKNRFSNICNIGFGGAMQGAYLIGAGVCGYGILTGTMSYGTLMAILQLISQIQSPFANITGYLPKYYAMLASAERLQEVEYTTKNQKESNIVKVVEFDKNVEVIEDEAKTLSEIMDFYRSNFMGICFSEAYFTYHPSNESIDKLNQSHRMEVFHDLNLSINKGEYVAFTGQSGCGKSTVLKIMMCLYTLDGGKCLLNIGNIKTSQDTFTKENVCNVSKILLDKSYRRLFSYVPQGNHLMSGTIREIITFSDKEGMKQEEKIWSALKIACGEEFVLELPEGIDTVLGERGHGLSEGQMQRIAIARAIFADNPILMLDESTSALDENTERQLISNLRAMTDKTVVIVTHRLAVLAICDKEIRFSEEGCVVRSCNGRDK